MSSNPDFELYDNVGRTGDQIRSYNTGTPTEDDLRRWAVRADPNGGDEHRPGPGTQPPAAPPEPAAVPERADLAGFAEALADRLPRTWTVDTREDADAEEQFGVAQMLWDDGEVSRAYGQFPPREALLTSSDGDDLLVIDRPQRAHQFLVGALLPRQPMRVGSVEAPHGIVVGDDPAQAAHAVATRLLPRYHHAVHQVRTDLLAFALHQGHQAVSDWKTVARPLRAAGYWPPDVRWQVPHDLRHGAATLMLAAGVDIKVVSDTLGHSDTRITRDIYQTVLDDLARAAAEAVIKLVPRARTGGSEGPSTGRSRRMPGMVQPKRTQEDAKETDGRSA